jgi:hypothetical protein
LGSYFIKREKTSLSKPYRSAALHTKIVVLGDHHHIRQQPRDGTVKTVAQGTLGHSTTEEYHGTGNHLG